MGSLPATCSLNGAIALVSMKSLILTLDRWVTGACLHLACLLLAVISCLGLWQVVSRFVFSQPSTFTEEAMRRLLI